jgi:GNAT superfamily N-acetyltransferase
MEPVLRRALAADVPAIQRVRHAVRENRLTSRSIPDAEVVQHLEVLGRGWVAEVGGEVVGFAIANAADGNLWALFVEPAHERAGIGRRLLEAAVSWCWERGLTRLWLTTEAASRARLFYESAGWEVTAFVAGGQVRMELVRGA